MHIWRIGRRKYVKGILEPLLKSGLFFVRACDLLRKNGVALTFEVEYTSIGESLPATLRFWNSSVKDYARIASGPIIIDDEEKEGTN